MFPGSLLGGVHVTTSLFFWVSTVAVRLEGASSFNTAIEMIFSSVALHSSVPSSPTLNTWLVGQLKSGVSFAVNRTCEDSAKSK